MILIIKRISYRKNALKNLDNKVDITLSHTCPYKYLPREMFLDEIEKSNDYDL